MANYHSKTPKYNAVYRSKLIPLAVQWGDWLQQRYAQVSISTMRSSLIMSPSTIRSASRATSAPIPRCASIPTTANQLPAFRWRWMLRTESETGEGRRGRLVRHYLPGAGRSCAEVQRKVLRFKCAATCASASGESKDLGLRRASDQGKPDRIYDRNHAAGPSEG